MKFQNTSLYRPLGAVACTLLIISPLSAQRSRSQQADRGDRRDRSAESAGDVGRSSRLQADPTARVVVGIDTNVDGRFDTIERIYVADLQRAIDSSRGRQERMQQQQQDSNRGSRSQGRPAGQSSDMQSRNQDRESRRRVRTASSKQSSEQQPSQRRGGEDQVGGRATTRVSGTVSETVRFSLVDGKEHVFAKLSTDQGQTIPVDFGTESDVEAIGGISDGDEITVVGRVARVNDRRVMRASRVQSGGESASIEHSSDQDLKRVRGQISALRTARFKGYDNPFRVARVDLNGGRSEVTILGPVDRLDDIDLQAGDEVQMLVRRGRYNGKPVLVADQIRSGERTARVSKPEGETFRPSENR